MHKELKKQTNINKIAFNTGINILNIFKITNSVRKPFQRNVKKKKTLKTFQLTTSKQNATHN